MVPFKTRMSRFIDESKVRTESPYDLKWIQLMAVSDLLSVDEGQLKCIYLYRSWHTDHDVYVDSKTSITAWIVQYVTRLCDKYDTVTLCYTQPNFVSVCFFFGTILNLDSKLCQIKCFIEWWYFEYFLIMNQSSYCVKIKSIGQCDKYQWNQIDYPCLKSKMLQDIKSVFKRLFNAWLTFVMMRRFFLSASIVKVFRSRQI